MTRAGALLAELHSDVGHKMHSRLDALGKAVSKDPKAVEAALNIPHDQTLLLFVAVGYPGAGPSETNARRVRKPLPAIAAWGNWDGTPVEA